MTFNSPSDIALLIDSTSPLTEEQRARTYFFLGDNSHLADESAADIFVVPLSLSYYDKEGNSAQIKETDIKDIAEFYRQFGGRDIKSSQPNDSEFTYAYEQIKARGFKHVYGLLIPNKLSKTCERAQAAARGVKGIELYIPTSHSGSGETTLVIDELIRNYSKGFEHVKKLGKKLADEAMLYLAPMNLDTLHKAGRIGNLEYMVGSKLSIMPVLTIQKSGPNDGGFVKQGVVRGSDKLKTVKYIVEQAQRYLGERKATGCVINKEMDELSEILAGEASKLPNFENEVPVVKDTSAIISANIGPAFALALLPVER